MPSDPPLTLFPRLDHTPMVDPEIPGIRGFRARLISHTPMALACLVCAFFVVYLGGCNQDHPVATSAPAESSALVEVRGVAAWSSPVRQMSRYIGSTRSVDTVRITSEVTGKVEWIGFSDEDLVREGQELLRLDSRRAQADLRAAVARLDRLKLSRSRLEAAYEAGAANLTELDDIRSAVAEAEAEVDFSAIVLEDHILRAPFTGRVARRLVSLGALVRPGDAIAVLNSVDPIEIAFAVPEVGLRSLEIGQTVIAEFAGLDKQFHGTLATTGALIDPATRSAEVYALVPNPTGELQPGMYAAVTLVTGTRPNAILIPESALITEGRRVEIFIVDEGAASRRQVRIKRRYRGIVEIAEGLADGTRVVTSGTQKLRDGTPVNFSIDEDLAMLGIIPGLPLSEQPVTLGIPAADPIPATGG